MNKYISIVSVMLISFSFGHDCPDLDPFDYGMCDMLLGWAWSGEDCESISGCSTVNSNGEDDAEWFFPIYDFCVVECSVHDQGVGGGIDEVGFDDPALALLKLDCSVFGQWQVVPIRGQGCTGELEQG